ncbi:MAG: susC [Bacteroidetes bacterium]|nr:susC [Bacteroidota bacterium]
MIFSSPFYGFKALIVSIYQNLLMKKSGIQISIPKPCHENWEAMDQTARGAFCHSCSKEVIDFTRMTDQQVIERLTTASRICGKFREDQVTRQLRLYRPASGFLRWRVYALSLLPLMALSCDVKGKVSTQDTSVSVQPHTTLGVMVRPDTITSAALPDTIHLTGRVLDADHQPLSLAIVSIVDTVTWQSYESATTDHEGYYSLKLAMKDHDRSKHVVKATHYSHSGQSVSFAHTSDQYHDFILNKSRELMGDIDISRIR